MSETKELIESIEVVVRERLNDDPFESTVALAQGSTVVKGSTVGVKVSINGNLYGCYKCFTSPTLSTSEVVENINELFENMLKEIKEYRK